MMKRLTWLLTLTTLAALALPAAAQYGREPRSDNGLRLFGGMFTPTADSEYWDGTFDDFTGESDDFEDWTAGIEYSRELRGNLRLLVGSSVFESSTEQSYRGFVDNHDNLISHDTTLTLANATLGLAVSLVPRQAPVVPYVGAGVGLYSWQLEEDGDFIDFGPGPRTIFSTRFKDDGVAAGWFWVAGLDIPITPDFAIFAQGRWHHAEDNLEGDFDDLGKIDLSGRELTAGLTWRF